MRPVKRAFAQGDPLSRIEDRVDDFADVLHDGPHRGRHMRKPIVQPIPIEDYKIEVVEDGPDQVYH